MNIIIFISKNIIKHLWSTTMLFKNSIWKDTKDFAFHKYCTCKLDFVEALLWVQQNDCWALVSVMFSVNRLSFTWHNVEATRKEVSSPLSVPKRPLQPDRAKERKHFLTPRFSNNVTQLVVCVTKHPLSLSNTTGVLEAIDISVSLSVR